MIQNKRLFLVLLILGMLSACQENRLETPADVNLKVEPNEINEQIILEVPPGNSPEIDGTIEQKEWENAVVESFFDGSELLAMGGGEFLYLGIRERTGEMIAVNVFINQGDEISILHSSAALGTAVYQKHSNSWMKIKDFEWCCRLANNSEQANNERTDFLNADGWAASNSRTGVPNEIEYQIKINNEDLKIAVSFLLASDPDQKIPWPAALDDDCIKPTPGGFPEELIFDTDQWGLIRFESTEK